MLALPQVPVGAYLAPPALVVAEERAATVDVDTNASVAIPLPASASVKAMVGAIPPPQTPVTADTLPPGTGPLAVDAVTILVTTNTLVAASPEPTACLVVVAALVQVPVRANITPLALVVAEESAAAIEVDADAAKTATRPPSSPMELVIVPVAAVQMPVTTHLHTLGTRPLAINTIPVLVAANTGVPAGSEPARSLLVVVAPPEVQVGGHATPMALQVAVQGAQAIWMHADAAEASPAPLSATVQPVIVTVPAVQVPVSADLDPLGTSPAPEVRRR